MSSRQPRIKREPVYNNDDDILAAPANDEDADADEFGEDDPGSEADDTYIPRQQLPEPTVLLRSVGHLMQQLEAGIIDLNPEYQRDVVWPAAKQTGLINSLMENFYIPPIILTDYSSPGATTEESLICVDGKQRLSSILAFVKGEIPCHDSRGRKWFFCHSLRARRSRVLPDSAKNRILHKELMSYKLSNLTPAQEEDLFQRVQMGMQLSGPEKMKASTGPWQELTQLFIQDFPEIVELMKDRSRGKDFGAILQCFSQLMEVKASTGVNIPILKTAHSHQLKLLADPESANDETRAHLRAVFETFQALIRTDPSVFTNANEYLKKIKTFAPIEMVAVAIIISLYSDTRNNRLLLGDIVDFRTWLRDEFVDLRLNKYTWDRVWIYIEELEERRGQNGTVMNRTVQAPETTGMGPFHRQPKRSNKEPEPAGETAAPKKKRVRETQDPEEPAPVIKQEQDTVTQQTALRSTKKARGKVKSFQQPGPDATLTSSAQSPVVGHTTAPDPDFTASLERNLIQEDTTPHAATRSQSNSQAETPLQVRQNRIKASNSYRAPPAPMIQVPQDAKSTACTTMPALGLAKRAGGSGRVIDLTGEEEQERQNLLFSFMK